MTTESVCNHVVIFSRNVTAMNVMKLSSIRPSCVYCLTTADIINVTKHKRMLAVNRMMLTVHLVMAVLLVQNFGSEVLQA